MRGLVRDAILSTDMSRHANIIADIEEHLAPIHDGGAVAVAATRAQRLRWLQLVVKCADVSNVTKGFSVAREWGLMVTDEMFAQGERERNEGLEVPISFPPPPLSYLFLRFTPPFPPYLFLRFIPPFPPSSSAPHHPLIYLRRVLARR